MDAQEKGFWTIGLFFIGIGLFVGFLIGLSFNAGSTVGGITGAAITDVRNEISCFDADGGTNVDVFGYAVDNDIRYFDNCKDDYYLYEAYCKDNAVHVIKYKCPFGCYENRCLQG